MSIEIATILSKQESLAMCIEEHRRQIARLESLMDVNDQRLDRIRKHEEERAWR